MTFWLLSEIGRPVRSIPVKVMVAARLATPTAVRSTVAPSALVAVSQPLYRPAGPLAG
jgi:hypothetical protein